MLRTRALASRKKRPQYTSRQTPADYFLRNPPLHQSINTMSKKLWSNKFVGVTALILILAIFTYIRFAHPQEESIQIWILAWIVALHLSINCTKDNTNRGIFAIGSSVFFSVVGTKFFFQNETEMIKELVSQLLLATGAGTGGNFLAQGIMDRDRASDSVPRHQRKTKPLSSSVRPTPRRRRHVHRNAF